VYLFEILIELKILPLRLRLSKQPLTMGDASLHLQMIQCSNLFPPSLESMLEFYMKAWVVRISTQKYLGNIGPPANWFIVSNIWMMWWISLKVAILPQSLG
jgi:hypothetical protein